MNKKNEKKEIHEELKLPFNDSKKLTANLLVKKDFILY